MSLSFLKIEVTTWISSGPQCLGKALLEQVGIGLGTPFVFLVRKYHSSPIFLCSVWTWYYSCRTIWRPCRKDQANPSFPILVKSKVLPTPMTTNLRHLIMWENNPPLVEVTDHQLFWNFAAEFTNRYWFWGKENRPILMQMYMWEEKWASINNAVFWHQLYHIQALWPGPVVETALSLSCQYHSSCKG